MNRGDLVAMLFDGYDATGKQLIYRKDQTGIVVKFGTHRKGQGSWPTVTVKFRNGQTTTVLESAVEVVIHS